MIVMLLSLVYCLSWESQIIVVPITTITICFCLCLAMRICLGLCPVSTPVTSLACSLYVFTCSVFKHCLVCLQTFWCCTVLYLMFRQEVLSFKSCVWSCHQVKYFDSHPSMIVGFARNKSVHTCILPHLTSHYRRFWNCTVFIDCWICSQF